MQAYVCSLMTYNQSFHFKLHSDSLKNLKIDYFLNKQDSCVLFTICHLSMWIIILQVVISSNSMYFCTLLKTEIFKGILMTQTETALKIT